MRGRRGEKDGIYRLYRLYRTGRSCKAERDLVSGEPWRWLNLIDGVREEVQYLEEGHRIIHCIRVSMLKMYGIIALDLLMISVIVSISANK